MAYIIPADYKTRIRDKQLQMVINDESTILTTAESTAMATVKDALASRFDVDYIFGLTDDDRDLQVVNWIISLVMYQIYERVPDAAVPKRIVKNYDDTLMILKDVADGKRSLFLKRLEVDDKPKTKFRWGGETRRV